MASEKENQGFKKSVSPEEQALRERVKEVILLVGRVATARPMSYRSGRMVL